jgi:hypothetical protein
MWIHGLSHACVQPHKSRPRLISGTTFVFLSSSGCKHCSLLLKGPHEAAHFELNCGHSTCPTIIVLTRRLIKVTDSDVG